MKRLRRRVAALEERIAALEATKPVDYTMPPRYDINIDPDPAVAELPTYVTWPTEDDEETKTGVYL